uniref:Uncharacterized protein n=1 Tax=Oryza brachyantha TaxID=4533 RepID=J3LJ26_ORYBR
MSRACSEEQAMLYVIIMASLRFTKYCYMHSCDQSVHVILTGFACTVSCLVHSYFCFCLLACVFGNSIWSSCFGV